MTAFRSGGPSAEQTAMMLSAAVAECDVAETRPLFSAGDA